MPCEIFVTVGSPGMSHPAVEDAVQTALARLRKKSGAVSVHFVGDTKMRNLNRLYRGIDRPTDVLSFAAEEGRNIGDIFLSVPYIRRQAKRFGVSYREEVRRMLIHGILHATGFDHDTKARAKRMFGLQERILRDLL